MPQHLSGTLRRVETQRGGESGPCPSKRRFCFIKKSALRMLASARLPSFSKYMREKKNLQLLCFPATPMPWASYFWRRCGGGKGTRVSRTGTGVFSYFRSYYPCQSAHPLLDGPQGRGLHRGICFFLPSEERLLVPLLKNTWKQLNRIALLQDNNIWCIFQSI